MKIMRNIGLASALLVSVMAAGSVCAATWTLSSSPGVVSGLTAATSAFSATNNTTATITATTAYYGGGAGVLSGSETDDPDHAMDNNGRIETLMISFSNGVGGITSADKVNLTSADFGWVYAGDSDFSVYAYTGSSASPSPSGVSYSNLTSNGWTEIGHYNSGGAGTKTFSNSVYSSHWLIGALNGLVTDSVRDTGDDYFKFASVTGTKCPTTGTLPSGCGGGGSHTGQAPEPGTLLLMGAGLFGLTRMSRRKVV